MGGYPFFQTYFFMNYLELKGYGTEFPAITIVPHQRLSFHIDRAEFDLEGFEAFLTLM